MLSEVREAESQASSAGDDSLESRLIETQVILRKLALKVRLGSAEAGVLAEEALLFLDRSREREAHLTLDVRALAEALKQNAERIQARRGIPELREPSVRAMPAGIAASLQSLRDRLSAARGESGSSDS